ncbi:TetR/AcrR family transcriptional regulator [Catenulispora rubra]|uniref:TetR/AcrR family transcriptional regulator n=1 Tax=Catenulispora rubra TaxID=280293 RepID=UPI00189215ED|nr:TetR/AcrR family transcriptional regulator [Catenulispora rubra]
MSVQERKQRERAQRERLIVATARELAEDQGWDAVTTRRLAESIEYSQPVLYSHFRGKREIIGAVALDGATELAAALRAAAASASASACTTSAATSSATAAADGPRARVTALARAWLDYAERNPAVYDALFNLDGGLAFAQEDTPAPLKDAFAALLETLGEVAGDGVHPGVFTELFWAALHGLATLTRAGRLPPELTEARLELLVDRLAVL